MAKLVNKHIEIVASTEHGLSSMSLASRTQIQAVLARYYRRVDVTIINTMSDLAALVARRPDMVFLGMKFIPSNPALGLADPNKIWLSEYLDTEGIAYTGSGSDAIELELNKELAKAQVTRAGLATAGYMVVRTDDILVPRDVTLQYPLFVKPTDRGGGKGVDAGSLVYSFSQLQTKVGELATDLKSDALVEEYLPGREFSVAVMKQLGSGQHVAMPLELVAPADASGARFLSSQIKSADTECHMPVTDMVLREKLNTLAVDTFQALGAQDYGRIDIRLDAAGVPHFLEANLLPSLLNNYGNFPKACLLNKGLAHKAIILNIVDLAFARAVIDYDYVLDIDEDLPALGALEPVRV